MKKLTTTICLTLAVLLGSVGTSWGADFDKGLAAYDSGDFATALREWKPLAEQGNADAQRNLAVMYRQGRGDPQDYKTVLKWYKLAADQRHVRAQSNLERLQKGVASEKPSPTVTAKKTSKIKSKPTPGFIPNYKVGIAAYRRGDWATALKHFRLGAVQGNTIAQHAIGVMYEKGRGVSRDLSLIHI